MDVVAFGEVLWDIIDGVPHIGGAPFNFAAHAVQCGLSSALVSAVGSKPNGDKTEWGQTTFAGVVVGLGGFVMSDPSVRQLRVQLHVG